MIWCRIYLTECVHRPEKNISTDLNLHGILLFELSKDTCLLIHATKHFYYFCKLHIGKFLEFKGFSNVISLSSHSICAFYLQKFEAQQCTLYVISDADATPGEQFPFSIQKMYLYYLETMY